MNVVDFLGSSRQPAAFESSTAFIKATQIKRDESNSQNLTKVLYPQKPFQISVS